MSHQLSHDTVFKNKLLTKVDARTNGHCHENHCINYKKTQPPPMVSLYQLGLFPPSECPGLCRYIMYFLLTEHTSPPILPSESNPAHIMVSEIA